jgi:hypothetical protein
MHALEITVTEAPHEADAACQRTLTEPTLVKVRSRTLRSCDAATGLPATPAEQVVAMTLHTFLGGIATLPALEPA